MCLLVCQRTENQNTLFYFFIYQGLLPCNVTAATITAVAPDPKNAILVNGNPPKTPVPLNTGVTNIDVEITSADGSNKKVGLIENDNTLKL